MQRNYKILTNEVWLKRKKTTPITIVSLTSSFKLLTRRTVLPPAETPGIPTRPAAAAAAAAAAFGIAKGLRAPGTAATGSPNFKIKHILRNTHKSLKKKVPLSAQELHTMLYKADHSTVKVIQRVVKWVVKLTEGRELFFIQIKSSKKWWGVKKKKNLSEP